jgi:membrane dipeptidase
MNRTIALIVAAAGIAACSESTPPAGSSPTPDAVDAQSLSAAIHAAALTLDTHVDIEPEFATAAMDPLNADLQVNLEKMRSGSLDAAFFIVYVGQTARTPENYAQAEADAIAKFDAIHRMTDMMYPDRIGLALRAADVERIVGEGQLAAAIGIENGYVIGRNLALLDDYYSRGARYMTLVHNGHNDIADSASPSDRLGDVPAEHGGVSDFGAQVIRRMNELGMMVDISHASKATALEAIELSQAPVIASHSSARAVGDHVRNLDDETLLRLRDNGGVVQVVAFDIYLKVRPPAYFEARRTLLQRLGLEGRVDPDDLDPVTRDAYLRGVAEIDAQWPPSTVADFVDHIDHIAELIGIDHVGISSDFGGGGGIAGWMDAAGTPNVTAELVRRGYSAADIDKIWSGNLLRAWRDVEAVADRL